MTGAASAGAPSSPSAATAPALMAMFISSLLDHTADGPLPGRVGPDAVEAPPDRPDTDIMPRQFRGDQWGCAIYCNFASENALQRQAVRPSGPGAGPAA